MSQQTTQFVVFRLIRMPCCNREMCLVGPRLPNYCQECGHKVYLRLKFKPQHTLFQDDRARLVYKEMA